MDDLYQINFEWPHTQPNTVIVTGSFDHWSSSLHLTKDSSGFKGGAKVPWNEKITYKYVVDGQWLVDASKPTESDPSGNVNNVFTAPPKPATPEPEITQSSPTEAEAEVEKVTDAPEDVVNTVLAADGTSSALEYVASGVGVVIQGVTGVDPVNVEKISLQSPKEGVSLLAASPSAEKSELSGKVNGQAPESTTEAVSAPVDLITPASSSVELSTHRQNVLLQITFFIPISSSNNYAKHLGGTSIFSGVVLGIPAVFSALALIPLIRVDKGNYKLPMHISCAAMILGLVLYSMAYHANFLYLILIGRCVNGLGFSMLMYCKKYCSDPRIVGIRRRTTLASWLVIGQGIGMTLGPFAGGLFFRVGFKNSVFNGYTSPTWTLALIWCIFWAFVKFFFQDPPPEEEEHDITPMDSMMIPAPSPSNLESHNNIQLVPRNNLSALHAQASTSSNILQSPSEPSESVLTESRISSSPILSNVPEQSLPKRLLQNFGMTPSQFGVTVCMCWFAMTCFFILGAWEANLPVFGAFFPKFHWSPFDAGNFIALGGITTFPFLVLNLFLARRVQDRHVLAFGVGLGMTALFIFLSLLRTNKVNYASAFVCWWLVALGFNVASTVTMSLLSKQLPASSNTWTSMIIQYSIYIGRVIGAIWGGSGVAVGMMNYVGLEITVVGIGALLFASFWKQLKAKTG